MPDNGQVERMNRTIKERFHYDDHDQLRLGRRLKTLKRLTPYEFICKRRTASRIAS